MADKSAIEWTDATWNPIVGCSIVSPGCTNCYAMKMAARIEAMTGERRSQGKPGAPHYDGTTKPSKAGAVWTGKLALAPDRILAEPLHWRKPRRIFVNSMGDLFHEDAPDAWIDRVFAVMALCPQHTFQVLTKRPERMRDYVGMRAGDYEVVLPDLAVAMTKSPCAAHVEDVRWPLPNLWLGVSAERQIEADERIPQLLATPAAVRFVSLEPLLGPIDLTTLLPDGPVGAFPEAKGRRLFGGLNGERSTYNVVRAGGRHKSIAYSHGWNPQKADARLDWIIVGGESGPSARPMHPDWARSLRDQCTAAGVPFFFKQWGEWASCFCARMGAGDMVFRQFTSFEQWVNKASTWVNGGVCLDSAGNNLRRGADFMAARDEGRFPITILHRIGKRAAGRLLDGREWNEFPAAAPLLPRRAGEGDRGAVEGAHS